MFHCCMFIPKKKCIERENTIPSKKQVPNVHLFWALHKSLAQSSSWLHQIFVALSENQKITIKQFSASHSRISQYWSWFKVHIFWEGHKILWNLHLIFALRPEGAENIILGSQVSYLCFWNPNCIRNPKMGSKQSITGPTEWCFFQITFLGTKKSSKKSDGFTSN